MGSLWRKFKSGMRIKSSIDINSLYVDVFLRSLGVGITMEV